MLQYSGKLGALIAPLFLTKLMKISYSNEKIEGLKTDALVFFLNKGGALGGQLKELDGKLGGQIKDLVKTGDFIGRLGEVRVVYPHGEVETRRLLFCGLGEKKTFTAETWRRAVAAAACEIARLHLKSVHLVVDSLASKKYSLDLLVQEAMLAAGLSWYKFEKFKGKPDKDESDPQPPAEVTFWSRTKSDLGISKKGGDTGQILAEAVNWTRDLVNHPGAHFTPSKFAEAAKKLAKENKFSCRVLDKKQIAKEGLGGLLGVARGSSEEPKFIIMDYGPRSKKPLVLVGKGITFDTGGISLKPAEKMEDMKMDMAGGAAVLGAFKAFSDLKLKKRVVGLIPTTENMPSGTAVKPGDVLTSHSGKTIEVINTDAEGRLILADALSYADKLKPQAVVDLATLTGAIMVALGSGPFVPAGLFTNDKKLSGLIQQAAAAGGENIWLQPGSPGVPGGAGWEPYTEALKSQVADLRNIALTPWGGSINAAAFLKEFVGKWPWAHLDIAGVAWAGKPEHYFSQGATGWGVRLLVNLVKNWR
jgi:leucyl aminopeptidase